MLRFKQGFHIQYNLESQHRYKGRAQKENKKIGFIIFGPDPPTQPPKSGNKNKKTCFLGGFLYNLEHKKLKFFHLATQHFHLQEPSTTATHHCHQPLMHPLPPPINANHNCGWWILVVGGISGGLMW